MKKDGSIVKNIIVSIFFVLSSGLTAIAQRQMENLDRGVIAVRTASDRYI